MSWGGSEFIEQTYFDEQFTQPGVVYFASSGDSPGTSWPATSPNVVAVGGTTLSRDPLTGDFLVENTWQDAGGGPSLVENRPDFQNRLARTVGPTRGTPDISFDANPATGVWVLDSHPIGNDSPGWLIVGGTSLSSPAVAAITNTKGQFRLSSEAENELLYSGKFGTEEVVLGNCGLNAGDFAREGWSFCTGIGSPRGKRLKHSVND